MRRALPTAPIAATGLVAGYATAVASGSRPLGGVVMASFGTVCISVWLARDGRRTAVLLTGIGLLAFALSHALAKLVGAWPAVLIQAAGTAAACWRLSDVRLRPAAR
jgi:tetrahydromethanopterin S-methyltransferase subunit C